METQGEIGEGQGKNKKKENDKPGIVYPYFNAK
jgi:hypothetical protein